MKNYKKMIEDVRRAAAANAHERQSRMMQDALRQLEQEIANARNVNDLITLGTLQSELYDMASALGLDI